MKKTQLSVSLHAPWIPNSDDLDTITDGWGLACVTVQIEHWSMKFTRRPLHAAGRLCHLSLPWIFDLSSLSLGVITQAKKNKKQDIHICAVTDIKLTYSCSLIAHTHTSQCYDVPGLLTIIPINTCMPSLCRSALWELRPFEVLSN